LELASAAQKKSIVWMVFLTVSLQKKKKSIVLNAAKKQKKQKKIRKAEVTP
jgi:heme exporter protein D